MTVSLLLQTLASHLWQSTWLALAIALALATLLRRGPSPVRFGLWLAASLKFIVPFGVLTALGSLIGARLPLSPRTASQVATFVDGFGTRLPITTATPAVRTATPVVEPSTVLTWLLAIWATGTVILLARWLVQWFRIRRTVRGATLVATVGGIPILESRWMADERCEPGVFGVLRPVVLVPAGMTQRLTVAQFDAVLAHECAHVRRRDNLSGAAHALVEALFWFHPLVWWLGRQLRIERERACDDDVLRGGTDAVTYAEGILSTCRFYVESRLMAVPGVTGADLRRRIETIVADELESPVTRGQRLLVAAALAIVVVTPIGLGVSLGAQQPNSFTGLQTVAERKFEIASIKLNPSGDQGWRLGPPGRGQVSIVNLELRRIVASSFRVQDKMIFGPAWLAEKRYDIVGRGPAEATNPEVWEMMRSLLAERFHLKYHVESREMPVYTLSIARSGSKLVPGEQGRCAEDLKAGKTCGDILFQPFGIGIYNMPIGGLTGGLARSIQDRPIVDKTGLTGRYDGMALWRPELMTDAQFAEVPTNVRPPDVGMFEAFEQQLGLKIEAGREPVQVIVVDEIQEPDEN